MEIIGIALAAFAAATIAAVSGFGGAVVLLPILVAALGARDAVIALTLAQLAGNGSRVVFNRDDIDRAVVGWFALGAVPLALLGGVAFAAAPVDLLRVLLGAFLIAAVAWRRLRRRPPPRPPLRSFSALGGVFGFLSALLGSVGPLLAPFFLAYGLTKTAYIGTEAAATIIMHTTKLVAYTGTGVLATGAALTGLALAPSMIAGSWLGKRLLARLNERTFATIIDAVLLASGTLLVLDP
ncbi:MAG: sulfite exporter TauE/SafE family protein [Actinomycetota bacterium]|nr:sulfite exporter TauE/SafE family protein [Actinomycetota bacterium]